jgi:hypothetical protein
MLLLPFAGGKTKLGHKKSPWALDGREIRGPD